MFGKWDSRLYRTGISNSRVNLGVLIRSYAAPGEMLGNFYAGNSEIPPLFARGIFLDSGSYRA